MEGIGTILNKIENYYHSQLKQAISDIIKYQVENNKGDLQKPLREYFETSMDEMHDAIVNDYYNLVTNSFKEMVNKCIKKLMKHNMDAKLSKISEQEIKKAHPEDFKT